MAETEFVTRELFNSEIASLRREIEGVADAAKLALQSADKATTIADANFEKRMDTTNEWRGALEDQAKGKASVQQLDALKEQVGKLEAAYNRAIGFGIAFGALGGLVAGMIGRWFGS